MDNTTLLSRWAVAQSPCSRCPHQVRKDIAQRTCLSLAASLFTFSAVPLCALSAEMVTGVWSWGSRGARFASNIFWAPLPNHHSTNSFDLASTQLFHHFVQLVTLPFAGRRCSCLAMFMFGACSVPYRTVPFWFVDLLPSAVVCPTAVQIFYTARFDTLRSVVMSAASNAPSAPSSLGDEIGRVRRRSQHHTGRVRLVWRRGGRFRPGKRCRRRYPCHWLYGSSKDGKASKINLTLVAGVRAANLRARQSKTVEASARQGDGLKESPSPSNEAKRLVVQKIVRFVSRNRQANEDCVLA